MPPNGKIPGTLRHFGTGNKYIRVHALTNLGCRNQSHNIWKPLLTFKTLVSPPVLLNPDFYISGDSTISPRGCGVIWLISGLPILNNYVSYVIFSLIVILLSSLRSKSKRLHDEPKDHQVLIYSNLTARELIEIDGRCWNMKRLTTAIVELYILLYCVGWVCSRQNANYKPLE